MKQKLIDTTLRDGEQAPGIVFSLNQRKCIAEMLVDAGVDEIEAGLPVMGGSDLEFAGWCKKLDIPVLNWCRADYRDIEAAKKTGLARIHISVPVSERLLTIFKKTRGWLEETMLECFKICQSDFDFISVGFMDASRTGKDYLEYLVKLAALIGFDRVRIADTTGIMHPTDVINMMEGIKNIPIDIEFHPHNDFGMATANGITALDTGINAVSATVLGIGERAGNARIEEMVFARQLRNQNTNINLSILREIAQYISRITGIPILSDKAVIGENVFSHETGIHAAAIIEDPLAFMPVQPEYFGIGNTRIIAGRHSGSRSIQHCLKEMSLSIDRKTASMLLPLIRLKAEKIGRNLKAGELEAIYYEYIGSGCNSHKRSMYTV